MVAKRTKEKNFEGVLSAAMTTPSILWDNRKKRAWLLPVISALAFASLRYIEWQKYTFQKEENGKHEKADVNYCTETKNTGSAARTFLRRNSFLVVHTADGEPVHEPPTFEDIVRNIWEGMCDGEDLCFSELSGSNIEDKDGIFGYDLCEAMCQRRVQLRKLQYYPASRSWLPLCKGQRVQVIFCQYVGEVLSCYCSTANGFVAGQRLAQAGTLTCLLDDFRSLYGAKWSMLPEDACDSSRGLPIGEKFEWIPKGYDSGHGHVHCSHGSSQSITEKQNRKIQRKTPGAVSQGKLVGANTIHLPRDPCLIYFG